MSNVRPQRRPDNEPNNAVVQELKLLNFHANCITAEDTEDSWLVGLADNEFDTRQYLMLQRSFEDDEQDVDLGMNTYYVERDDQGYSGYGGIERFDLHVDRVRVKLNDTGRRNLHVEFIEVTFNPLEDDRLARLRHRLQRIFAGCDCLFLHAA